MTQFKDSVQVGDLTVEVSTVDLSFTVGAGWETCLFWDDNSEVVGRYEKAAEAIQAHGAFLNPDVLRCVLELCDSIDAQWEE